MKLSKIAGFLNGSLNGKDIEVERVGSLEVEFENAIIYIEGEEYLEKALSKKPVAIVAPHGICIDNIPCIFVDDPKLAFIKLLNIFSEKREEPPGIDPRASVDDRAEVDKNATVMLGVVIMEGAQILANSIIYPNCIIEKDACVGRNSILHSGVIIKEKCAVGDDCIIHSGVVIGSDGFGFYEKDGRVLKIPQNGNVKIGDRVEVGANCCIDRATLGTTEIGDDTKLDNLVHIAHNVKIGKKCYIAAQAGISGSVTVGEHVTILGQVGIGDHLSIADETIILGQSGILNDIKKADVLFGTPSRCVKEHHKIHASLKYLPDLLKRTKRLEREIEKSRDDS
ncbi:MAG: UDP-3-O-(3-hydroxymyristoyl)glucosamine N-acyltransferase [Spirochaetota bacterium]|nr:UDP-3-O-(3-hydroxymyristoyl)glucosamine N-acyltransferase [Spirochaetota bacterium]